jgi:hypothetical protein
MCLILIRDPGVEVNFDDIKNTCENNPHGWGYVIPDRGKLEIRRYFNPNGNDPDEAYRVLDEARDQQVFMHFRFCTHGDRNKANVHPFPALQKRKDGMQVWVMHNGTVQGFKEKGNMSDTYHFTDKLIAPLLRRFMKYTGKQRLLNDPMLPPIIEKFAGGWSKFVLIDEYGNYQIIGDGTEHKPGLWLSNDYSFKAKYRYPEKKETKACTVWEDKDDDYGTYRYGHGYPNYVGDSKSWIDDYNKEKEEAKVQPPFTADSSKAGTTSCIEKSEVAEDPIDLETAETFCDVLGFRDIKEVVLLSEAQIFELITEYPEHMVLLVRDLALALDNDC